MADRLFRYLLREPEAREEALPTLERVEWRWSDFDGPLGEVFPELAEMRKAMGGHAEADIQFDTKAVEFVPWVRRFLAQIRKNWFVPYAAMSLRGHVSVSFNVHKYGTITAAADLVCTVLRVEFRL